MKWIRFNWKSTLIFKRGRGLDCVLASSCSWRLLCPCVPAPVIPWDTPPTDRYVTTGKRHYKRWAGCPASDSWAQVEAPEHTAGPTLCQWVSRPGSPGRGARERQPSVIRPLAPDLPGRSRERAPICFADSKDWPRGTSGCCRWVWHNQGLRTKNMTLHMHKCWLHVFELRRAFL